MNEVQPIRPTRTRAYGVSIPSRHSGERACCYRTGRCQSAYVTIVRTLRMVVIAAIAAASLLTNVGGNAFAADCSRTFSPDPPMRFVGFGVGAGAGAA